MTIYTKFQPDNNRHIGDVLSKDNAIGINVVQFPKLTANYTIYQSMSKLGQVSLEEIHMGDGWFGNWVLVVGCANMRIGSAVFADPILFVNNFISRMNELLSNSSI